MQSSLILSIALMLIFAKVFEIPFRKYHINPVIAYVLAGFLISNTLGFVVNSVELSYIAQLSLILIMLYTGLTTDFREIASSFKEVLLIALSGVASTIISTYLILYILGFKPFVALFIAIVLSNTATETVAGILHKERDIYFKSIATGASFIDDILAVVFTTIVLTMGFNEITSQDLILIIVKITLFLFVCLYLTNILVNKYSHVFNILSQNYYSFVSIVVTLVFMLAFISKTIGLSEVIGAYIAGLIIARSREYHDPLLKSRINLMNFTSEFITILDALFLPIFFTYIGLTYSVSSIDINLLIPILIIAFVSKITGVYSVARILFRNNIKAFTIGIVMTGRGLLELVLLKIGYEIGVVDQEIYSTVLTTSLLTIILTPLLYSIVKKRVK